MVSILTRSLKTDFFGETDSSDSEVSSPNKNAVSSLTLFWDVPGGIFSSSSSSSDSDKLNSGCDPIDDSANDSTVASSMTSSPLVVSSVFDSAGFRASDIPFLALRVGFLNVISVSISSNLKIEFIWCSNSIWQYLGSF